MGYNKDIIKMSIDIIEQVELILKTLNVDAHDAKVSLNHEQLILISNEIQEFFQQKEKITKSVSEFHKTLCDSLKILDMPRVREMITRALKIDINPCGSKDTTCHMCKTVFPNKRSLGSHIKGCPKLPKKEKQPLDDKIPKPVKEKKNKKSNMSSNVTSSESSESSAREKEVIANELDIESE